LENKKTLKNVTKIKKRKKTFFTSMPTSTAKQVSKKQRLFAIYKDYQQLLWHTGNK